MSNAFGEVCWSCPLSQTGHQTSDTQSFHDELHPIEKKTKHLGLADPVVFIIPEWGGEFFSCKQSYQKDASFLDKGWKMFKTCHRDPLMLAHFLGCLVMPHRRFPHSDESITPVAMELLVAPYLLTKKECWPWLLPSCHHHPLRSLRVSGLVAWLANGSSLPNAKSKGEKKVCHSTPKVGISKRNLQLLFRNCLAWCKKSRLGRYFACLYKKWCFNLKW